MNSSSQKSDRRTFLKTTGLATLAGSSLPILAEPSQVDASQTDYHICMGLNMKTENGHEPGAAPGPNLPPNDLHSCKGGNTCANLGACGTGKYARQYWVGENNCANNAGSKWHGTGGCGVPIGTGNSGHIETQLNSAAPSKGQSAALLGQPVWNIARSRFEHKMFSQGKGFETPTSFKKPPEQTGPLYANSWQPGETYNKGNLPEPYPEPKPDKLRAPSSPSKTKAGS